jgi:membrane-associated phospholipid phosphatase
MALPDGHLPYLTMAIVSFLPALMLFIWRPLKTRTFNMQSELDRRLAFIPEFIIPYQIFYYPFLVGAFWVTWNTVWFRQLAFHFAFGQALSSLIWVIIPTQVKRGDPYYRQDKFWHRFAQRFQGFDDYQIYTFPSFHVFQSLTCALYLTRAVSHLDPILWIAAGSIVLSTLFLKQHYIADVLGAIAMFFLSWWVTGLVF